MMPKPAASTSIVTQMKTKAASWVREALIAKVKLPGPLS